MLKTLPKLKGSAEDGTEEYFEKKFRARIWEWEQLNTKPTSYDMM